jgi:hypothetical protein
MKDITNVNLHQETFEMITIKWIHLALVEVPAKNKQKGTVFQGRNFTMSCFNFFERNQV